IASRYLVDFAAAFAFAQVALLLSLPRRWLAALLITSTGLALTTAWFGEKQSHRILVTAGELRDQMPHPHQVAPPLTRRCRPAGAPPPEPDRNRAVIPRLGRARPGLPPARAVRRIARIRTRPTPSASPAPRRGPGRRGAPTRDAGRPPRRHRSGTAAPPCAGR